MKQRFKVKAAVYLVLRDHKANDKVLLSRRYNTGYKDGQYSMVAGHIDGDERLEVALARETKEEVDIDIDPNDLELVHVMHARSEIEGTTDDEYLDFYFATDKYLGEPKIMETDKCDDLSWFEVGNPPENTVDKVRLALLDIAKNNLYSGFNWED